MKKLWKKIDNTWKALIIISAILSAGATGALAYSELRTEVAENTAARLINTFERLSAARRHRRLSQIEWQRWCHAGIRLKIFKVCPVRKISYNPGSDFVKILDKEV